MSSAAHRSSSSVRASTSPDTTTAEIPLTVAIFNRSPQGAISCSARERPQASETMPPRPDSRTSSRLRSATTRAASCSDSAPATQAAAISPWE
ncbi:hypothetical protein PICSAR26_04566 [Mycobacterium avium subsp. paratuberculosis]|nr:hypothetical protein PICSAR10_03557 [Mycobacterium avium subsp. paratuberculosis]CAG7172883.1 hypothetical protein PICSAR252_01959 [Mycobacterium avium subsp. paratuberculosis]CAG7273087.1 hypothetical protein PICSAR26_04566 [Mycobacterium avium subsp. paratuberculosis]CAG7352178.1 hypothetical protein PICSAR65_04564 [Mycobacterium avium subsp. paratuberculosis]